MAAPPAPAFVAAGLCALVTAAVLATHLLLPCTGTEDAPPYWHDPVCSVDPWAPCNGPPGLADRPPQGYRLAGSAGEAREGGRQLRSTGLGPGPRKGPHKGARGGRNRSRTKTRLSLDIDLATLGQYRCGPEGCGVAESRQQGSIGWAWAEAERVGAG